MHISKIRTEKPKFSAYKPNFAFSANPKTNVNSLLAIPYNPYEPQPYERWTLKGMLDFPKEISFIDWRQAIENTINIYVIQGTAK